ncbi:hypothetical protein CVIRNUC_005701 [Coccomyxa viridis]|uniref:DUF4281 domain-containing protein n=1 Tax=Coccomyxa viridis TaxID=1274662 RepID=A0AAV1I555_9CHLO|nr:hypothetical protein CVIRNUC_005701 [Coccomyxa viridis]
MRCKIWVGQQGSSAKQPNSPLPAKILAHLDASALQQTERILKSKALFVAGATLYTALLVMWWPRGIGQLCREVYQSCTPLPNVHVLAGVFKSAHATALAWLHLLLLDIAQAREVWLDGLRHAIPTGHSIILCFMFGPLGMLSHMTTRTVQRRSKRSFVAKASSA